MSTQVVAASTASSPSAVFDCRETGWWWIATIASRAYLAFIMTLAVAAIAPAVVSWDSFVVRSGSMAPTVVAGDVVVTSPITDQPVHPGQVIAFRDLDRRAPDGSRETVIHRVVADLGDGTYTTAGDANQSPDRRPVALPQSNLRPL